MALTKIDNNRQLVIEPRGDTWLVFIEKKGRTPSLTKRQLIRQTPCGATEAEVLKIAEILKIELDIKSNVILKNDEAVIAFEKNA